MEARHRCDLQKSKEAAVKLLAEKSAALVATAVEVGRRGAVCLRRPAAVTISCCCTLPVSCSPVGSSTAATAGY